MSFVAKAGLQEFFFFKSDMVDNAFKEFNLDINFQVGLPNIGRPHVSSLI